MEVSFVVKDGEGERLIPLNTWAERDEVTMAKADGVAELAIYQKIVAASLLGGAFVERERRAALRIRARSIFEEMEQRRPAPAVELAIHESKRARRRREGRAKGKRG